MRAVPKLPCSPYSAADEKGDERESHGPVSLETGFTFPEKDSAEDTWDSVVRRVESELHRQGFKGKTTPVRGKKVRERLLLHIFRRWQ